MKALRDVFGDTLVALGKTNPNVVVLDADLANSTKADKFAVAHPDRFLEMGIAEQNFVGVAVGLASLGFVPWLSSFTVFFTHRAADPIRMLVAQTHANVKIGAAYAGLMTGLTGKTHQDVEDLAIMRAMPGLGGLVAEILFEASPRRVIRFGIEDRWGESAPNDYLLEAFKMSPPRLSERIQKLVA
jgi:transketolase